MFYAHPLFGEDEPIWTNNFSSGLKVLGQPPTRRRQSSITHLPPSTFHHQPTGFFEVRGGPIWPSRQNALRSGLGGARFSPVVSP